MQQISIRYLLPRLLSRATTPAILACTVLLGACTKQAAPETARILRLTGDVWVTPKGQKTPHRPVKGKRLYLGDTVQTGAEGVTALQFKSGHQVELGPGSRLLIHTKPGLGTDDARSATVEALLFAGNARAHRRSAPKAPGFTLRIGTPYALTDLTSHTAEIHVSAVTGLSVLLGEVVLYPREGPKKTLTAGTSMSVDGLVVPIPSVEALELSLRAQPPMPLEPPAPPTIPSIDFESAGGAFRIERGTVHAGAAQAGKLRAGDALLMLRTADVYLGEARIRLALTTGARLKIDNVATESGTSIRYHIRGIARITPPTSYEGPRHQLTLPGDAITLDGIPFTVHAERSGTSVIAATRPVYLNKGDRVDPGYTGRSMRDATTRVAPSFHTHVVAEPNTTTTITFDGRAPDVSFKWTPKTESTPSTFTLEPAQGDGTRRQVLTHASTYRIRSVPAGNYTWSVIHGASSIQGELSIAQGEANGGCADCGRVNTIRATGEKTVVYYQHGLPALAFAWKEFEGAQQYTVKIFEADALQTPIIRRETRVPGLNLPHNGLTAGTYYWLATGETSQGAQVGSTSLNTLEIRHDNTQTGLAITAPENGARIRGTRIVTRGILPPDTTLRIEGRIVTPTRGASFEAPVILRKGLNRVVYQTTSSDGLSAYHVRDVIRE